MSDRHSKTATLCPCGKPTPPSTFICPDCQHQAVADLREIADHLRHIDDKRAHRGSRSWVGGSTPSAEAPLPFDTRVRSVLLPARNALTTWARMVLDGPATPTLPARRDTARLDRMRSELGAWDRLAQQIEDGEVIVSGDGRGLDSVRETLREDIAAARLSADLTDLADVAAWLVEHTSWAATQEWAGEFADEVADIRASLDRLMDAPAERVALGTCDCGHILAAEAGKTTTTCPHCGTGYDVQQRRLDLLDKADDLVVSVKESVRLLRVVGHDIDARTVYAAIRHMGIAPALTTKIPGSKRPVSVYRLGVIHEAVDQIASDPQTRREVENAKRGAA